MNTQERVAELKRQFHSMMNGVVSASMRSKGVGYHVNYGVDVTRLVTIALSIGKDKDLSQALWKENVRECRLLAPMIQPVGDFPCELADIWIESMNTPEEAQYVSMYLFQHLSYAETKVFEWIADERRYFQLCGFYTVARLLFGGVRFYGREANEFIDQSTVSLHSDDTIVAKAAYNALQKYALQNDYQARIVENIFNGNHQ